MNRVWTALLLLATLFVAAAVVYVLGHNDKVPAAGTVATTFVSPSSGSTGGSTTTSGSTTTTGSPSSSGSSTPTATKTVVFLGDDWTAGVGTSSPAQRFANILGGQLHVKVIVVAADGAGYAKHGPGGDSYVELASKVVDAKPYMVVVSGGRNDVTDDLNTLKLEAKTLFTTLRSGLPAARIVAVAPFWGDSDPPSTLADVAKAVKSGVGGSVNGSYVDVPDPLHGKLSDMATNQADPNDAGNLAIAQALLANLQTVLAAPIPTAAPSSSHSSSHNPKNGSGHS